MMKFKFFEKNYFRWSILCAISILLIYTSCRKAFIVQRDQDILKSTTVDASLMRWFKNQHAHDTLSTNPYHIFDNTGRISSGKTANPEYDIIWERGRSFYKGDSTVAEIPLTSLKEEKRLLRNVDSSRFKNSFTKLLLLRKGSTTNAYIMNVIADDGIKISAKQFQDVFLLEKPDAFNGFVFYYTLEGKLLNGFRYAHGKAIQRLMPAAPSSKIAGAKYFVKDLCYISYQIDIFQKSCVTVLDQTADVTVCGFIDAGTITVGGWVDCGSGGSNPPSNPGNDQGGGGGGDDGPSSGQDISPTADIHNLATNPCIASLIEELRVQSGSAASFTEIGLFLNAFFGTNNHYNIWFTDQEFVTAPDGTVLDGVAETQQSPNWPYNHSSFEVNVVLSDSQLENASSEFIATIVLHEIMHAFLRSQGVSSEQQHQEMATPAHRELMANTLINLFPTLSKADADALVWGGLTENNQVSPAIDITDEWTEFKANHTQSEVAAIQASFASYKNKTKGHGCP